VDCIVTLTKSVAIEGAALSHVGSARAARLTKSSQTLCDSGLQGVPFPHSPGKHSTDEACYR
jgi:hypothetical protein